MTRVHDTDLAVAATGLVRPSATSVPSTGSTSRCGEVFGVLGPNGASKTTT